MDHRKALYGSGFSPLWILGRDACRLQRKCAFRHGKTNSGTLRLRQGTIGRRHVCWKHLRKHLQFIMSDAVSVRSFRYLRSIWKLPRSTDLLSKAFLAWFLPELRLLFWYRPQ